MRLAPIGAFGGMAYTIGQYGLRSLKPLAQFTAEVWIVSIVFVVVVLGGIARAAGFSLFKLLRYFREEILITLGTSSSEAVMAPLMLKLEQLGCDRRILFDARRVVSPAADAGVAERLAVMDDSNVARQMLSMSAATPYLENERDAVRAVCEHRRGGGEGWRGRADRRRS